MSSPLMLELTRHELFSLPPDTPAVGEAFRVEVTSDKRPTFWALARVVLSHVNTGHKGIQNHEIRRVFFRNETRSENEIFRGGIVDFSAGKMASGQKLLDQISKATNTPIITRFWHSPDPSFGLVLHTNGMGIILDSTGQSNLRRIFKWGSREDGEQLWELNTNEFHSFCSRMIEDSTSQFNLLMWWEKLTSDEKTAIATRCEVADWNNLLRLFTWVLQLITHHFGPYYVEDCRDSWWDFPKPIPICYDRPAVLFARRWQEVLLRIVCPAFWPSEPCQHRWHRNEAGIENSVTCEIPTMHEVLEAQLGLREFLRPHLSTKEIEALFVP